MNINFVISLVNANVRRSHINNGFSKRNIPFQFFDALQPSALLDQYIDIAVPSLKLAKLSNGEKACFMSHIALWEKLVNSEHYYMTIFEDDVVLGKNAEQLFSSYDWLEERFSSNDKFVIRLETSCIAVKRYDSTLETVWGRKFTLLDSEEFGTAGYILSKQAAIFLLGYFKSIDGKSIKAIDKCLFGDLISNNNIRIYQLEPAICIQEDKLNRKNSILTSQLEHDRRMVENNNKIPKNKGIIYLIYKLATKWKRMKEKKLRSQEQLNNMIKYE
ncbi:glycosyltransferase family 25 protein [Actinobacillus lignieresii]|uniref:Glycosyl transferase family protein n=1 Tax=Actinobacillus lignieresii TaxID=720 RepID=A0A380TQX0_ACTLI|nr:glycosyltransferase family 25 protein [Actinobacillus lignieresii]SUT90584.1 glycosyl transferase family protein [Actinobacillus lignieresii]VEB25612.1 glycosyl transferase family protein [Actinobacillus lignieresii]